MLGTPEERRELFIKMSKEWEEDQDMVKDFVEEFIEYSGIDNNHFWDEIIYKDKTYFVGSKKDISKEYIREYLYREVLESILMIKEMDYSHNNRKPDEYYSIENDEILPKVRNDLIKQLEFYPVYLCEIDKIKEVAEFEY